MPAEPKVNILLVDDRPQNLVALESVLANLGQTLVKAESGREALRHLLHDDFAVILLDVQMPELDGFETAQLIRQRERSRSTPIIFLTAINKSETHVTRGYSLGAVDYVFKPFEPQILRAKVVAFVDLAKKTCELEREVEQRKRAEARSRRAEEQLRRLNEELEQRVTERTAALEAANRELEREIEEHRRTEKERARLLYEIQVADRRKDEFLAMLAHELRNPLAAIANADYALEELMAGDPRLQRFRETISRQTKHLARMVDDLLDVSRITQGKIALQKEPVELAAAVHQAVETTRPLIEARGHRLSVTVPEEPVWVEADPTRLEQILANLLNNAAKYTPPGGKVELVARLADASGRKGKRGRSRGAGERGGANGVANVVNGSGASGSPTPLPVGGLVEIRVRDNGVGIPPDLLPRIFELFTQESRSLARSEGGLGIGLALVESLVEMHGGSIAVESDGAGKGSEFILQLPTVEWRSGGYPQSGSMAEWRSGLGGRGGQSGRAEEAPGVPHAQRVLVVEDNVDAAETLTDILELWGHEVRVARDGLAAIAEAPIYLPSVVLLDIGLPGLDGYEVARRLRQQDALAQTLLVALTGYGQEENRRQSEEAGFDLHLTKPVDPHELKRLLAGALRV